MKTYYECITKKTFLDRYRYLKMFSNPFEETFGTQRYLNQKFYTSREWRQFREEIILRDSGCDLGIDTCPIFDSRNIVIHHINPIKPYDLKMSTGDILDPNNVICCSKRTHQAIHYGEENFYLDKPISRSKNDTKLW